MTVNILMNKKTHFHVLLFDKDLYEKQPKLYVTNKSNEPEPYCSIRMQLFWEGLSGLKHKSAQDNPES